MIRITVTGDTFRIRKRLKDNGFGWRPRSKEWVKTVAEGSLNSILEALRPMRSWSSNPTPVIVVSLIQVDINGDRMNKKVLGIKLRPEGERTGTDFLEQFKNDVQIVTAIPVPPDSEQEIEEDDEENGGNVDDSFY